MTRFTLTATALGAALLGACGNSDGAADPDTQFTLYVTIDNIGTGSGRVTVEGRDGECADDDANCMYAIDAATGTSLTAVTNSGQFVGWSGDCSGTAATVAVAGAAGETKTCTATFADEATAGVAREGILIGNSRACSPVAGPPAGFDCNVPYGGSYNINAPSPGLDAGLQDLNEYCYGYVDVTDFSSEDHGVVTMVTSRANVTGTFTGSYYSLQGAVAQPFEDIDSVQITTDGDDVTVDFPGAITLQDDPTLGLSIDGADGFFEDVRWAMFGSDPSNNQFGVLCRIGVDVEDAELLSNEHVIDALSQVSGGETPYVVYFGVANNETINGWDDVPRLGEAVNWFQLDGNQLALMGELQQE